MKKIMLTLALMMAIAMNAAADNYYSYLILENSDGTTLSYVANELEITFSDGNLIVSQNGTATSHPLSSLSKMFFSNSTSSIQSADEEKTAETGEVFDLQGRRVAAQMRLADINRQLPKGVYIVKNGEKSVKFTVK